jgi:hypothetical protein
VRRRAAQGSADAAQLATALRGAIRRLTDAYIFGALIEADYREKLRELKNQMERVDTAPDRE